MIELQRALTVDFITRRRLNAPAVWLRPESASPSADDAVKSPDQLSTNILEWSDDRGLAVRLVDGFIELQIKSPDDVWVSKFLESCRHIGVDTRTSFGFADRICSAIFHIDSPASIDKWANLWPKGSKDKAGNWVETKFVTSDLPTPRSKPIWRDSQPLPGSRFAGQLVVWRPNGKPAATDIDQGLEDLEARPIAATTMPKIITAIAFATIAYWIDVYLAGERDWDASLTHTIGGWIARLQIEGADINERGKALEGVCWSCIDDTESAASLIEFLKTLGATNDLGVAYSRAAADLERSKVAIVPGWNALEKFFGSQAKVGIRRAFRAGIDLDVIERFAEQYVFDTSSHTFIDREALLRGLPYEHKRDDLFNQYDNANVYIGGKPKNPFRLYAASSLRTDVQQREFLPGQAPGIITRFSRLHGLLSDDDRRPDDYSVLNTFAGFAINPVASPDPAIMHSAVSMLDRLLGLLTQDHDEQILYLKKFLAHIARYPAVKPQVCPIIVGGQGIGKSVFGETLMAALFGEMAGSADAATLADNKFLITPFIGKLITFIDEVRLESAGSINTIKKLVRSDLVSGQVKFGHQRDYYIPSRLLIASNSPDIGLSPADAADRAFFFIVSYTAENKRMTDREFQSWAVGLKEFYATFTAALKAVIFKQHLMRHLFDIEVTRQELENLEHSSRNDESVVRSTMPKAREVARQIVAEAHVVWNQDITGWFNGTQVRDAIRRVDGARSRVEVSQVMMEWERAGVVEAVSGGCHRFRWGYGRLCEKLGEAHNLILHPVWPTAPGADWETNGVKSMNGAPPWRGIKSGQKQQRETERRDYDPDAMQDY